VRAGRYLGDAGGTDQPANGAAVAEHAGRTYVTLSNVNGMLAVYRVRNDGMLKRLRRWPHEIDPWADQG
jgi:hypothetical protein